MKQKYAIGFITFMLATVLAACVHDYPAMTPDGEEGIDPTLVEVSTEVTLDLELLPLEIITNKAHRGITKARAGEQTDYRRRFIIEAWRDGKPLAASSPYYNRGRWSCLPQRSPSIRRGGIHGATANRQPGK